MVEKRYKAVFFSWATNVGNPVDQLTQLLDPLGPGWSSHEALLVLLKTFNWITARP